MTSEPNLAGARVLIVEDDGLIATWALETLQDHGCTVTGIARTLDEARDAIRAPAALDCVVLDVRLSGEVSGEIAATLMSRNIPFIITSGYDISLSELNQVAYLAKPYTADALARAVRQAIPNERRIVA